jgi:methyl-accepting chemotaxis protein
MNTNDKTVLTAMGALLAGTASYGLAYDNLILALVLGLAIFCAAMVAGWTSRDGSFSRLALPVLGMAMVALLIHVARGREVAHFAVFAFLAVTVVYRHWLPVVMGAGAIAVHHLSFNYLQQWGFGPVCFTQPSLATVLEHASYVVAEAGVLIVLAQRAHTEFAAGAELETVAQRLNGTNGQVDFGALQMSTQIAATRGMLEALQRVEQAISSVRASTDSIGTAAGQIASGSQDLSMRTERTAGSLQQTASAMEELTGTVDQTAASASRALQFAASAAAVAQRGSETVGKVVTTMNEINSSSNRIGDITGVIDSIAFQTNILALNAAVEAARAGEHGRGFAVVASEVRALSQRSAAAAREIKALIGTSVQWVGTGTRLVSEAGATMTELVGSVQQLSTLVGEISAATGEQSQGLRQVNGAVNELDQMTQQNAALVEESAAAAESLREQAAALVQAVSVFNTRSSEMQPA